MPLTLAVVVPCYKPHLSKLLRLVASLAVQTRPPDEIVIACSSVEPHEIPTLPALPATVGVRWVLTRGRANAAQNRNMGSAVSRCDVLSYIDADDIAHPRRCEAVLAAIEGGADIVLHNYATDLARHVWSDSVSAPTFDCLRQAPSGCVIHIGDWRTPLHHSQATVRRGVWEVEKYPEGAEFERREDAVFCGRIVDRAGIRTAYLATPLSVYDAAGAWVDCDEKN